MASESLPRYMFLHQDSQEMSDKRIRTYQVYKESNDKAERVFVKRVNNTISNTHKPHSESIYNLEYSNKYGLLLQATENEVLVINNEGLQSNLLKGKQNTENSKAVKFAGKLFLSPSEEILAIYSESLIQLLHTEKLPAITSLPFTERQDFDRLLWLTDNKFLLWGFQETAFLITINPKTLERVSEEYMQGALECTGASIVGTNLLICQKLEILIYQIGQHSLIKKVDLKMEDHGWMYYEYSYIVDVFRVNVHKSPFELNTRLKVPLDKEDVLGLVMVFYDDQDFENSERCLTFFRGNLLQGGKDIRGNENFYVAQDRNELYFGQYEKIPFAVKVAYVGCFICIMIERSSTVYVVDPFQKFEVINIYSPHGKLDFKAQGKFFRGMGVMKNMLPFQKRVPEGVKSGILPTIVNDFNGQFLSLYFAEQETNLTVPFPATIIALTQTNLYRRYAISSLGGIDKDQDQQIIAEMQKIQRSPYLQNRKQQRVKAIPEERINNQPRKNIEQQEEHSKKEDGLVKQNQSKNVLFGTTNAEQKFQKKEDNSNRDQVISITVPQLGNTINQNQSKIINLFGQKTSTTQNILFGEKKPVQATKTSIFDVKPSQAPKTSLFGEKKPVQATKTSIFDVKPSQAPKTSLFGEKKPVQATKTSIFDVKPSQAPKPSQKTQPQTKPTNFFDVQKPPQAPQTAIFDVKPSQVLNPPLFGAQKNQSQPKSGVIEQLQKPDTPINGTIVNKSPPKQKSPFPISKSQTIPNIQAFDEKQTFKGKNKKSVFGKLDGELLFKAHDISIDNLNAYLEGYQSAKFSKQQLTVQAIEQFCENELRQFETAQKLCLGGSLQRLLQKAESSRNNYLYYQQILQSSSKEAITQSQIQAQLSQLENRVVKGLYYNGHINPKQNKKSKMPAVGMSLQRQRRKMDFLVDDFQTVINRVTDNLTKVNEEMITYYQSVQNKRMKRIMREKQMRETQYAKVFNFNKFEDNYDQDSQNSVTLGEDSTKTKIYSSFIKYRNDKKKKATIMAIVNLSQSNPKPKYTLPHLEQEEIKPQIIEKAEQSSSGKAKLPATPSFSKINQAFTMNSPSQPLQKVQVPQVRVQELQTFQNQANSEVLDGSLSQSDDSIPLPVANRQMSKIQIIPAKQKANLSSIFGTAENLGFANTATKGQGSLFGAKIQSKEDNKEIKKQEEANKSNKTDTRDQDTKKLTNFLLNNGLDDKKTEGNTKAALNTPTSKQLQIPDDKKKAQEQKSRPSLFANQQKTTPDLPADKTATEPQKSLFQSSQGNKSITTDTNISTANVVQTQKTTTPPTPNTTNLFTQATSTNLLNNTTSGNTAPQQLPPINQEHKPVFGGPNKFLSQNLQPSQPQKPAFDPKAMMFGGGSTAQKSFTSITGQNVFPQTNPLIQQNTQQSSQQNSVFGSFNSSGPFSNQNTANQSSSFLNNTPNQINTFNNGNMAGNQSNMFINSNFAANQGNTMFNDTSSPSNNNFFSSNPPNSNPLVGSFGAQNVNTGVFGQSRANTFGQSRANTFGQINNSGGNFLQGFAPKPSTMPVGINPNLLAPRK